MEAQCLWETFVSNPDAVRLDLPNLVHFRLGIGVRIGEACVVRPSEVRPGEVAKPVRVPAAI